jgi:hypothetical protein
MVGCLLACLPAFLLAGLLSQVMFGVGHTKSNLTIEFTLFTTTMYRPNDNEIYSSRHRRCCHHAATNYGNPVKLVELSPLNDFPLQKRGGGDSTNKRNFERPPLFIAIKWSSSSRNGRFLSMKADPNSIPRLLEHFTGNVKKKRKKLKKDFEEHRHNAVVLGPEQVRHRKH